MGKKTKKEVDAAGPADPETEEKRRLRSLALSRGLLRRSPASPAAPLPPSAAVAKLRGRDIVKRGQRKSRYLFSFPGLLGPLSGGGRVGELAGLATKNPVLYLDFPQGRMKLFGTHVYPKNKYLTLQFKKSAKGVMCEDCFDSMIVFSDAWWIGSKEENPEELQLEFPTNLSEGKHAADYEFKGGAGAVAGEVCSGNKPGKDYTQPLSPDSGSEDDVPEDPYLTAEKSTKNVTDTTPVRQSVRTAGKKLSYAESSSGDDSLASDAEASEMADEKVKPGIDNATKSSKLANILAKDFDPGTSTIAASDNDFDNNKFHLTDNIEQSSLSSKSSKADLADKKETLVQATLSTLFDKAVDEKSKRSANDSPGSRAASAKRKLISSKQTTEHIQVKGSNKKAARSSGKKAVTRSVPQQKQSQVPDDGIEEISSDSQDDSDEDWAA